MSEANDEAKAKVAEHLFSKVKRSSELRSAHAGYAGWLPAFNAKIHAAVVARQLVA